MLSIIPLPSLRNLSSQGGRAGMATYGLHMAPPMHTTNMSKGPWLLTIYQAYSYAHADAANLASQCTEPPPEWHKPQFYVHKLNLQEHRIIVSLDDQ